MDALFSNGKAPSPGSLPAAQDLPQQRPRPQDPLSSQSVAFSHYNNIGAQLPSTPHPAPLVDGGIREQAAQCLRNIKTVLESIDVPFDDIVKVTVYLTNLADLGRRQRDLHHLLPGLRHRPCRRLSAGSAA